MQSGVWNAMSYGLPTAMVAKMEFPERDVVALAGDGAFLMTIGDLPTAAAEIARLLRPGGISVHLYPGHRRIVEGHLFMPFVHWLPKNKLRYWAIVACTWAHVEPRGGWYNIANSPVTVRAKRYFDFSVNSTYYRPPRRVEQVFRSAGLVPRFESHLHDRVRGTLLAKIPGAVLNRLLCTFASCVFIAAKEPAR